MNDDLPDLWTNWEENSTPIAPLTRREKQARRLMLHGITTDEKIAACLCISVGTAATHVDHLREKYQAHSRAELVAYLFQGVIIRLFGSVSKEQDDERTHDLRSSTTCVRG